jgi:hypothetical protein
MSVSQNPGSVTATTSTPVTVTGRSVTALRWYMRIAGGILLLLMILGFADERFNLFSIIANQGPFIVLALAAMPTSSSSIEASSGDKHTGWRFPVS